jgi:predicted transposase YbfD/YdcC
MNFTMLPFTLQLDCTPLALDLQELTAAFATIPDHRGRRGRRYPLPLLLTIAVLAKLAGYSQLREIADWARLRQAELTALLGFPRATLPHPTTWSRVFAQACDPADVDHVLHTFLTRPRRSPRPGRQVRLSLDGKTLAGTIPLGQTAGVHLVAAYFPAAGVVAAQLAVPAKANELTVAPTVLQAVPLAGCVVTGDAMFAQRTLSAQIVAAGGDYLWTVKKNQRELYDDITWLFAPLRPDERASDVDFRATETVDKGHGRLEERVLRVSSLLKGYSRWPGLEQVVEVTSRVTDGRGRTTIRVRYGVTSLSAAAASPARLLALVRGHWQQENGLHYRRDVTLGEDRSQVRMGRAPQVLASLNNLVIGLATRHKQPNLAAWQRQLAYCWDKALHREPAARLAGA